MASAILGLAVLGTSVFAIAGPGSAMNSSGHDERGVAMTPYMQCMSLQQQFDSAIKSHANAAKVTEAKSLRSDAGRLCTNGKSEDGIIKLRQALKDLGVSPNMG